MARIPFTKMHGCGNDYIYVNAMLHSIPNPSEAAIAWSDRHKGIGSDGLVLIDKSPVPEADFSMRIFNADGSEAMMCGNASRCIGKYLYEKGLIPSHAPNNGDCGDNGMQIRLHTLSGIKILFLHIINNKVESVTVDMGEPVFEDNHLFNHSIAKTLSNTITQKAYTPLSSERKATGRRAMLGNGAGGEASLFVSMGNPHYVIFTDDIDQVGEKGRVLEYHPAFPQRCNIEFAASLSSPKGDTIVPTDKTIEAPIPEQSSPTRSLSGAVGGAFRVRVWERGSGITQACGTGACATAVAAALTGRAGRRSDIVMDGGTLSIEWCENDRSADGHSFQKNHVYMTGPAAFVFEGEIKL